MINVNKFRHFCITSDKTHNFPDPIDKEDGSNISCASFDGWQIRFEKFHMSKNIPPFENVPRRKQSLKRNSLGLRKCRLPVLLPWQVSRTGFRRHQQLWKERRKRDLRAGN
eukprot:g35581.t1